MLVLSLASACGYHFAGGGAGPRPGLQRIAIPVMENTTTESGLESILTTDLRREFILRSPYQVVPTDQAEAVFHGKIKNIFTTELAHAGPEQTIETRLYITLDIRCQDVRTGEILWQDVQLTYYEKYLQSTDPIITFDNRRRAETIISRDLAVRIRDRFMSNF